MTWNSSGKAFFKSAVWDKDGVLINEKAVKVFGLGDPQKALFEKLVLATGDTVNILGVVKNVYWRSLKHGHSPQIFAPDSYEAFYSVKIDLSNVQETISHIETSFHNAFPEDPFEYYFLDDKFNRQYQEDIQFGKLFSAITILAIFIACLGLYGLISFSATLKIKEVGIRKVLGASIGDIMALLSKEYMALLLIANLFAIPAIMYWGNSWLENYAFRIDLGLEVYIIPVLMLLVISFLTVSHRTYKTAKANPVESLRME